MQYRRVIRDPFWTAVIGAVIGFALSEVKGPMFGIWTDVFGPRRERNLKDYRDAQDRIALRDSLQKAESWQAELDSLEQVEKQEALLCIKREIELSKENPCVSSIYYHRGILGKGVNWRIGSTKCSQRFIIPAYGRDIPVALLDPSWVKRYFFYMPIVKEVDVARIFGICQSSP